MAYTISRGLAYIIDNIYTITSLGLNDKYTGISTKDKTENS